MPAVLMLIHLVEELDLVDRLRRNRSPTRAHHRGAELFLHGVDVVLVHEFQGSAHGNIESTDHPLHLWPRPIPGA